MAGSTKSSGTKKKSGGSAGRKNTGAKSAATKKNGKASIEKNAETPKVKADKTSLLTQIFPGIMMLAAVLCGLCLFIPDTMGLLGPFLRDFLRGLFAGGSYLVPLLIFVGAFLWKKDRQNKAVWCKVIFAFFLITFFSAFLCECGTDMSKSGSFDIAAFYRSGTQLGGGGAIGSTVGYLLFRAIGKAGSIIVSVALVLLLGIFFVGLTPYVIWLNIAYRIHERRERAEEEGRHAPSWVDERRYYDAEEERERSARRREEISEAEQSAQASAGGMNAGGAAAPRGRHTIDMSSENTSLDATSPREKRKKRVPRIFGLPDTETDDNPAGTDASAGSTATAGTTAPAGGEDALQSIDPAVFESVLRKQTEAAERGNLSDGSGDDAVAVTQQQPFGDDSFDSESGGAMEGTPAEKIAEFPAHGSSGGNTAAGAVGVGAAFAAAGTADVFAAAATSGTAVGSAAAADAFAAGADNGSAAGASTTDSTNGMNNGGASDGATANSMTANGAGGASTDGPISEELLTKFLTNSDENGKGATVADNYASEIMDGQRSPELILQRDALDELPEKPKPRSHPKYTFPPLSLLSKPVAPESTDISEELQTTARKLVETLTSFKVNAKVVNISRGPTITRYELSPESGVRVRSIASLVDDIALNLATSGVRIEAPIPGRAAVGIEVPNRVVSTVYLRELVSAEKFSASQSRLTAALGEDVAGEPIYLDIAKMPHLLIAGATGMGKSVCINSIIVSLLYKAKPDELKLILVDPKKVELNIYNGLPHLLVPVVSDSKKAAGALAWAVGEMERRFTLIEEVGVRDLRGYNKAVERDPDREKLPQIVIIIDELADLMMTARDDVEESICRLAQKARAAGMHLLIGTQRPSVDVITGLIKANIPSRIAFHVSSQMDSRVILDMVGAEKLLGRGDMLFAPVGAPKPIRVQGAYVSETEIDDIISFIGKTYGEGDYDDSIMEQIEKEALRCGTTGKKGGGAQISGDIGDDGSDPMLKSAIELAVENGKISTSLIQRRLSLGYGRAAKLIDRMQEMGVVSAPDGQKPRTVLISKQQFMEMVINNET